MAYAFHAPRFLISQVRVVSKITRVINLVNAFGKDDDDLERRSVGDASFFFFFFF